MEVACRSFFKERINIKLRGEISLKTKNFLEKFKSITLDSIKKERESIDKLYKDFVGKIEKERQKAMTFLDEIENLVGNFKNQVNKMDEYIITMITQSDRLLELVSKEKQELTEKIELYMMINDDEASSIKIQDVFNCFSTENFGPFNFSPNYEPNISNIIKSQLDSAYSRILDYSSKVKFTFSKNFSESFNHKPLMLDPKDSIQEKILNQAINQSVKEIYSSLGNYR